MIEGKDKVLSERTPVWWYMGRPMYATLWRPKVGVAPEGIMKISTESYEIQHDLHSGQGNEYDSVHDDINYGYLFTQKHTFAPSAQ